MAHVAVIPQGSATPLAPYSPGVKAGDVLHVSGMLALDQEGRCAGPEDAAVQTRHVLEAIRSVVETAGGSMSDIAFNQIFLKDMSDYAAMNLVYKEYFLSNPPARYCIRADLVRPEFLVEICSTAYLDNRSGRTEMAAIKIGQM